MTERGRSRFVLTLATVVLVGAAAASVALRQSPPGRAARSAPAGGPAPASSSAASAASAPAQRRQSGSPIAGHDYHHDVSPPLRSLPPVTRPAPPPELEPSENPVEPAAHEDAPDPVVQRTLYPSSMPAPTLDFAGTSYADSVCFCVPPDPNGEVGATQFVQLVNTALQVFDKGTGASVLGPLGIATLWSGFGGVCETGGRGDPVVIYDQLAKRWLITQFAAAPNADPTDECIAVSTSYDATGSYYRYAFHLGPDFFDYPHLGVWPGAYYMSMIVFGQGQGVVLGPQPFAFDRAAMLAGDPATFVTTGITGGPSEAPFLPSDLDGTTLPPAGAPNSFVEWPAGGTYKIFHFHADFATPENTTFTLFASPPAAAFTQLCLYSCVPQADTSYKLESLSDRLMYRLAYRNFGDHESLVGNYAVSSNGVAGTRWFELRGVTNGPPAVFQESTYQPDGDWRWLGSVAMDGSGDLALGFSASSPTINPQVRYAGRLAGDALNTLAQGEATLHAGTGSQTAPYGRNRWGDYSDLTVDPGNECTFWYTNEYLDTITDRGWRTRIGSFKFPACVPGPGAAAVRIAKTADATNVPADGQVGFTVSLTNGGNAAATGVAVDDNLPRGGGVDWSLDASGSDPGWSIGGSPPNERLVYAPGTLAAASSTRAHVVSSPTGTTCGLYRNAASFTSANAGFGGASATELAGTRLVAFSESFDGVTPPALPAGWTATSTSGPGPLWATSSAGSPGPPADTAPNAAFVASSGNSNLQDQSLDSPSIPIRTGLVQLTFRQNYYLVQGSEGGVLEISVDGGPFQDILDAGGTFVAGGYNDTSIHSPDNSLAGRRIWSGQSSGFQTTRVDLPSTLAGKSIKLRWRWADLRYSGYGWRVDSITLTDGLDCGPSAVGVASLTARRGAKGVTVRWRTASEARILGFDVMRQDGLTRTKLNRRLIPARPQHTYSYLAPRTPTTAEYWLRATRLDGSHAWFGPVVARV